MVSSPLCVSYSVCSYCNLERECVCVLLYVSYSVCSYCNFVCVLCVCVLALVFSLVPGVSSLCHAAGVVC